MLRYFWLFFFLINFLGAYAQTNSLIVQLDDQKKPFLNHTVGVKENFYSIGRMYNMSPRVFAPYNGMELTSGLSIGQAVKIPLNESNFWQSGGRKENETVVPVYHLVQAKETVTSISKLYNADKAMVISWNNISGEKISIGDKIIIGFLKVDKTVSPLASQGVGPRAEPPVPIIEKPKEEKPKSVKPVEEKKISVDKKPLSKDTIKQVVVKTEDKPVINNPVVPEQKPTEITLSTYSGNGFFREEYNSQTLNGKNIQKSMMKGGSFKSTSGWTDGKYYILIDGIERGTILQLTNTINNKVIYAKVLTGIAETKPGAVESFLISNAAAEQLGLNSTGFELQISWAKD